MHSSFRRAGALLGLFLASIPALAQHEGSGRPGQDPFARPQTAAPTRSIGNYRSHSYQNGILTIQSTDGGTLRIRPWAESIVRVEYFPKGQPVQEIPSVSVAQTPQSLARSCKGEGWDGGPVKGQPYVGARINDSPTAIQWHLDCPGEIIIQKNPLRISYQRDAETLVAEAAGSFQQLGAAGSSAAGVGVSFRLTPDEHLYGTGSRALPLDRRGHRLSLYNEAHYGYQNGESTLNVTLPTVMSSRGYMVFFDNHAPGVLDLGATEKNTLEYRAEGLGSLAYFIIAGDSYAAILDRYTWLTGRQPLPPRWGLGLIQSRFGYKTEQEMLHVARRMRQAGFPLEALVLDLYWFGGTTRQGDFRWQPQQFPDPKRMISRLDSNGVKTILISEPYVMRTSLNDSLVRRRELVGRDAAGKSYTVGSFWAGPATLLDMDRPATRRWLWQQYDRLKQDGVGGWWSDLGEPENQPADMLYDQGPTRQIHNAYGQAWASILQEGYAEKYPQERLFNLARSGWAGMQRNSVFPWSGDVSRSWSGLQAQVPIMLSMGMGGVGYMHSDAGGFAGSNVDPELYTRWLQMASFGPIMRPHGVVMPEPFWYPEPYQSIVRRYTHLRYELLPYLYTLAWENAETGTPLARPMNYGPTSRVTLPVPVQVRSSTPQPLTEEERAAGFTEEGGDWSWNSKASSSWGLARLTARQRQQFRANNTAALANVNDQFLLGSALLVAPVLQPGQRRRNVVLPPGHWIDFYSHHTYGGSQTVGMAAPLAQVPLLVRAGAFLPRAPYVASTAHYRPDTLHVRYYADSTVPESSFTLYDDDGKSAPARQLGTYESIAFAGLVGRGQTVVQIRRSGSGYPGRPAQHVINLEIPRVTAPPAAVLLNSQPLPDSSWQYHAGTQLLLLPIRLTDQPVRVTIRGLALNEQLTAPTPELLTLEAPSNRTFGGHTELRYTLHAPGSYALRIRNAAGQVVRTFVPGEQAAGPHSLTWDGTNDQGQPLPGGVYSAHLQDQHQRLILLRD
ncbi:TIM-barrel domain-containing protein [Hymenobacter chitinivorans]|uniref:Galactose mutarotase-like protein n=1 Tax=Hymenobacter chitinivorans DSM 11115 TaxID=1121954 RepID=A0A2M9AQW6_9BACT|nr:TIM-barrel domain-containing protein [Hymenobacter chitinivorans]PJJ48078.1 galactose mutarotase-like protein [Hymenobacter chitinivorans DSM 11115]